MKKICYQCAKYMTKLWMTIQSITYRLRDVMISCTILLLTVSLILLNILIYTSSYFVGLTLCRNSLVITVLPVFVISYFVLFIALICAIIGAGYKAFKAGIKKFLSFFAIVLVLGIVVLMGFRFFTPGHNAILRGFHTAVNNRINLDGIKKWVTTEKKDLQANMQNSLPESCWPEVIRDLAPRKVEIRTASDNSFYVQLTWGSGMLGSFGLIVSPENMEIPTTDLQKNASQQVELFKGVYIWHEVK